ncbi:MAG: leucine-rich repeat protein [Candidatus Hermodarchaeota archaeon]
MNLRQQWEEVLNHLLQTLSEEEELRIYILLTMCDHLRVHKDNPISETKLNEHIKKFFWIPDPSTLRDPIIDYNALHELLEKLNTWECPKDIMPSSVPICELQWHDNEFFLQLPLAERDIWIFKMFHLKLAEKWLTYIFSLADENQQKKPATEFFDFCLKILGVLLSHKDKLSLNQIKEESGISFYAVRKYCSYLQKAGMITQEPAARGQTSSWLTDLQYSQAENLRKTTFFQLQSFQGKPRFYLQLLLKIHLPLQFEDWSEQKLALLEQKSQELLFIFANNELLTHEDIITSLQDQSDVSKTQLSSEELSKLLEFLVMTDFLQIQEDSSITLSYSVNPKYSLALRELLELWDLKRHIATQSLDLDQTTTILLAGKPLPLPRGILSQRGPLAKFHTRKNLEMIQETFLYPLATNPGGKIFLLMGPPRTGKTSLVHYFLEGYNPSQELMEGSLKHLTWKSPSQASRLWINEHQGNVFLYLLLDDFYHNDPQPHQSFLVTLLTNLIDAPDEWLQNYFPAWQTIQDGWKDNWKTLPYELPANLTALNEYLELASSFSTSEDYYLVILIDQAENWLEALHNRKQEALLGKLMQVINQSKHIGVCFSVRPNGFWLLKSHLLTIPSTSSPKIVELILPLLGGEDLELFMQILKSHEDPRFWKLDFTIKAQRKLHEELSSNPPLVSLAIEDYCRQIEESIDLEEVLDEDDNILRILGEKLGDLDQLLEQRIEALYWKNPLAILALRCLVSIPNDTQEVARGVGKGLSASQILQRIQEGYPIHGADPLESIRKAILKKDETDRIQELKEALEGLIQEGLIQVVPTGEEPQVYHYKLGHDTLAENSKLFPQANYERLRQFEAVESIINLFRGNAMYFITDPLAQLFLNFPQLFSVNRAALDLILSSLSNLSSSIQQQFFQVIFDSDQCSLSLSQHIYVLQYLIELPNQNDIRKMYLDSFDKDKWFENYKKQVSSEILAEQDPLEWLLSKSFIEYVKNEKERQALSDLISLPFLTWKHLFLRSQGSNGTIKYLNLNKLNLESLPESFGDLQNLESLDLQNNALKSLPKSFGTLIKLERLELMGNPIQSLPESFKNLKNVLTTKYPDLDPLEAIVLFLLEIQICKPLVQTSTIYKTICGFTSENNHVTDLMLYGQELETLPESFGQLRYLRTLDLRQNRLQILPKNFSNLVNLKELYLGNNHLKTLPEKFGDLTALEILWLSGNPLMSLPNSFGNLINLRKLNMWESQLQSLPGTFGNLKNLTWLCLNNNQLTHLTDSFGQLSNLDHLELQNNKIETLPASFGELTNLTWLSLNDNQLYTLPESFGRLNNLQVLDLSSNQFVTLPEVFETLENLQKLYLGENQINSLPENFKNLQKLKELYLLDNPLAQSQEKQYQIENLLLNCKIYWQLTE